MTTNDNIEKSYAYLCGWMQAHVQGAIQALEQGNIKRALEILRKGLAINPDEKTH
jgi:Tfp pilus assembly protein PilF